VAATGSRHRRRVRKRVLGATFALIGIRVWGATAAAHRKPDALAFAGITLGGAAVVTGIILVATTL
jgi:hypothetical protein